MLVFFKLNSDVTGKFGSKRLFNGSLLGWFITTTTEYASFSASRVWFWCRSSFPRGMNTLITLQYIAYYPIFYRLTFLTMNKLMIIVYHLVILAVLYGAIFIDLQFQTIQVHQVIQLVHPLNQTIQWVSFKSFIRYFNAFNVLASSRSSFLNMIGFRVRRKPTEIPTDNKKRKRRIQSLDIKGM
jgi:hypothetical protein